MRERYIKSSIKRVVLLMISTMIIFSSITTNTTGNKDATLYPESIKTTTEWSEDIKLTDCVNWFENGYASRPTIGVVNASIYIIYENSWGTFPYYGYELGYLKSLDNGKSWTYKNFTNYDSHASSMPDICVSNGNIYVVWQDYKDSPGCPEIYFKNSSDNGEHWSNDTALTSNDGKASQWPKIAINGSYIHVVWGDIRTGNYEIFYKRGVLQSNGSIIWDDGLGNISQDRQLTNYTAGSDCPSGIVVKGSSIYVIFDRYTGGYWEVFFIKSIDNGANWSDPVCISENDGITSFDSRIVASDTALHVIWRETRPAVHRDEIYYSNSTDGGNNWSAPKRLTYAPDVDTYPGCIAVNDSWVWATYRDNRSGDWRGYYMLSENDGINWTPEIELCLNNSGAPLLVIESGYVHAVFTSDRTGNSEIYYKCSPPFGSEPANVTITANPSTLTADGISNSTLTIWVYNETGLPMPNQIVDLTVNGCGSVSNVTDNGDGSYTTIYTTGTVAGNVIITATVGFVSNNTTIVLKPGVITRIEINPLGPVIYNKTESAQYTAIGYDIYQNINTTWQPVWNVDGDVGTINETGFFTATKEGSGAVNCSDAITEIYNISLVTVINRKPTINSVSPLTNVTITETQTQTFTVNATDPDNDTLTYQWYLSDTLLINETHSSYTFTPSENFSGNYSVKVSVTDGKEFANHTWIVTVINVKQLQETINILSTQLTQLIQNYTDLLENLTWLSNYLTSIWSQLNSSELNNTELQTKLQGLNENLTALKNQIVLSDQNITILQDLIGSLNQTLNLSNEQITGLWGMLNQSITNETNFRNLIAQLNQSINSLQGEIEKLKEENEQIVREREAAEERLMIAAVVLVGVILICVLIGVARKKK